MITQITETGEKQIRAIYIGNRRERYFGPMTYGQTGWLTFCIHAKDKNIVGFVPDCKEIQGWFLPRKDFYIPDL